MSEIRRLFLALWPDDGVRGQIARLAAGRVPPGSRPVSAENYHVTLAFLGAVDRERAACVVGRMGDVLALPFRFELDLVAHWRRPGILWLGPDKVSQTLLDLQAGIGERLAHCGFVADEKSYRPHVTLARHARGQIRPVRVAPVQWTVDSFVLAESRPGPQGVQYELVETWPLGKS